MFACRRIFGLVPVPVIYTDRLPEGVGGEARGPLVRIRPVYRERGDEGIHQHELQHVAQFYVAWLVAGVILAAAGYVVGELYAIGTWSFDGLLAQRAAAWAAAGGALAHPLAYRLIGRYRLYAEASAYAKQMRYRDGLGGALTLEAAAMRLTAARYELGLTFEQARAAIVSERAAILDIDFTPRCREASGDTSRRRPK